MKQHIQGVHHIAVAVPDLALARKFYIELLGAEEISALEWRAGNAMIDAIVGLRDSAAKQFIARLGNLYIEPFEYLAPLPAPQDPARGVHQYGYTHFCLQVDDIMAVHAKMVAAGIDFHTPPDPNHIVTAPDGSRSGYCATYGRDFFGNVFELIEIHANTQIPPL